MFDVIVADPPWTFKDQLPGPGRGAAKHYDTMTVAEIAALPVRDVVARNAALLLWVPSAVIRDGLAVAHAWGFTEKQTWIWVKLRKGGKASDTGEVPDHTVGDLGFGMGRYARNCHEIALFCVRGSAPPAVHDVRTVFLHEGLAHSEKPENVQDALDRMYPEGKRLELFARRRRAGWMCIGNEAPSTKDQDIRDTLAWLISKLGT